jgi:hypothetical protein
MRARLNRLLASFAVAGALIFAPGATQPASADSGGCTSYSSGGTVVTPPTVGGGTIGVSQTVHIIFATHCPGSTAATRGNWKPPACWWAPVFTPQALKDYAYANYVNASSADLTWAKMLEYYETDGGKGETTPPGYKSTAGPPYSNWNIGATPGGMWWSLVFNETMVGTPEFADCLLHTQNADGEPWSWVADAQPGPANVQEPTVTQEDLAEYAAAIMQLPESVFESSPAAGQTVNLPMWVWAGDAAKGQYPYPRQELDLCTNYDVGGAPICADVWATVDSVTLDPGTPNAADARVFDQGCAVTAQGTIGTPYTGQPGDPPCGITYLHSTAQNSFYYPSVALKWKVTWNGAGAGWPKYDTMAGAPHQVTVQEIQTIVGQ